MCRFSCKQSTLRLVVSIGSTSRIHASISPARIDWSTRKHLHQGRMAIDGFAPTSWNFRSLGFVLTHTMSTLQESRVRRTVRMIAFGLASAAVGMVYLMVFGTMHSRGFIPGTKADYWIKTEHRSDNEWSFEVIHTGEEPPITASPGYTVLLQERSSGRTGAMFNAFRASHWSFMYVDLPDGDLADKLPDA